MQRSLQHRLNNSIVTVANFIDISFIIATPFYIIQKSLCLPLLFYHTNDDAVAYNNDNFGYSTIDRSQ
jgi:hypothetical protein